MRKFTLAWVSFLDDFLILYPVYMMTGSFHISLFEGIFHVNKIYVWFKIATITHALPFPVHQQTDFPPKYLVVSRLLLRDFLPEWNSRPGATTGVNSHRGDLCRHDILWWYYVNRICEFCLCCNRSLIPEMSAHFNIPVLIIWNVIKYMHNCLKASKAECCNGGCWIFSW